MHADTTTTAPEASRWPAAPLTRVLELLATASGAPLGPRIAWEAAAEGIASGGGQVGRTLTVAARRAGLRVGGFDSSCPGPAALVELGVPAVTWLPGPSGGRWVVTVGRRRRSLEVVIVDEAGERRRRLRPAQLAAWLRRQLPEGEGDKLRWMRCEAQLPLASLATDEQSLRNPIHRLLDIARLERADLGVVLVYAASLGAFSVAVPIAVQALVNTVAFGSVLQPLVVLSILLAGCLGFVAVIRVMQAIIVEALQRRLFVRTAADFARRLPRLDPEAKRFHGPELANRFFDVVTLQKAGASLLIDGLALILQMAVGMVLLAFYHPMLLAFDLALLAAVALVVFVGGRGAVSTSLAESKRKYAVAAWLEDVAANPLRFSEANARAHADLRAELLIREWLIARSEHFTRILRQLCGGVGLQVIASTALLGIGGWLVIQRQLTLGQLVAAELVVAAIGVGLGKLSKQLESFYDATTSATKLAKVVDMPLERRGGELLIGAGPFELEIRSAVVPDGVLAIAPGTKLATNSVMIDAFFGLRGNDEIDIVFDGRPVRALDLEILRTQLALVRGVELVTGTLMDNLDPRPHSERSARIDDVLELVGLRERVYTMPDELQTALLPSGAPLRPVEARRLTLAQAMLRRPRLLLLDGSLDRLGLDAPTHARLLDHLFADDAPWTLVVASDDPAILARCTLRV